MINKFPSSTYFIIVYTNSFRFFPVNFTTITVSYTFQRRLGYYVLQVYIPDILIVLLSWIAFWMNPESAGDRLTIGITTILTIMFLSGAVNASMPPVSYAKAVDWYLITSFAFIFLSVIESLAAYVMFSRPVKKDSSFEKKSEVSPNVNKDDEVNNNDIDSGVDVFVVVVVVAVFIGSDQTRPALRKLLYLRNIAQQKARFIQLGLFTSMPDDRQNYVFFIFLV